MNVGLTQISQWIVYKYRGAHKNVTGKKKYIHFNRGYLRKFSKLNLNVVYDILSKDGASHMNAIDNWVICNEINHRGYEQ
jgi:hypothetical protein